MYNDLFTIMVNLNKESTLKEKFTLTVNKINDTEELQGMYK